MQFTKFAGKSTTERIKQQTAHSRRVQPYGSRVNSKCLFGFQLFMPLTLNSTSGSW